MAIVIGPCWMNFCSQKLKRRATFGFNRMALRATHPKLYSMSWGLLFKIALSVADLMSLGYLGAEIWHRWPIICGVLSKISVMPTSQRQLMLLRIIFAKPLVKYSCTQPIMFLCRLLHGHEWNYFPLLTGRIVLSNKKRNLRKYSVVFFKAFSKKIVIWRTL